MKIALLGTSTKDLKLVKDIVKAVEDKTGEIVECIIISKFDNFTDNDKTVIKTEIDRETQTSIIDDIRTYDYKLAPGLKYEDPPDSPKQNHKRPYKYHK